MHYNKLFQDREIWKIFCGGARPLSRPLPTDEGETPSQTPPHFLGAYGASIVAPSALHTSRFRRWVLCVPYFQCRLLATLTVTNVVQGKRSQCWKFTGPPNQKSWLRQWPKTGGFRENGGRNLRFWFRDPQKALAYAEPRRLTYFASKLLHASRLQPFSTTPKKVAKSLGARNHACAEPKPLNRFG